MTTPEERRQEQHRRRIEKAAKVAGNGQEQAKPNGNGAEAKPAAEPWRNILLLTKRKEVRDCLANVAFILRLDPAFAGKLKYDEFLEAAVTHDLPWRPGGEWREWSDADDVRLADWCQQRRVPVRPGTVADGVAAVADEHRFHPVREYLDRLAWDGGERLDTWARDYLGVQDTSYARAVGRKWLISAVARILGKRVKVDHALIIEGKQRQKKSSAFEALCPDPAWFTDSIADLGTKDSAQDLRGKWIIELGELSAMKRSEVERIKSFLTRTTDHYRPSYGKRSRDFDRRNVFGGTTNGAEYLRDETGNRRFWPVHAGTIDLPALRRDRDQLWAEAVTAYKTGETWWLDDETEELAAQEQELRREPDPWEEIVLPWLEKRAAPVSKDELLSMLKILPEQREQKHANRAAKILAMAGWQRRRKRTAMVREWLYYPPSGDGPDDPAA
jgi:putative DNA primase/helicase